MKNTKEKTATTFTKRKREKIISGIISDVYKGRYTPQEMDRIRRSFVLWFEQDQDSDLKDRYLFDLLKLEREAPEDLERAEQMLKECKRRLNIAEQSTKSIKLGRPRSFGRVTTRVAAVVIPLLVVAGVVWFDKDGSNVQVFAQEYNVSNGAIEELNLPDSTEVMINSGSSLEVKFEKERRIVKLSGESFFNVAKDRDRPFVVQTDELTVTVLGTQFNVESYADRNLAMVMLVEGSVSLTTNDGSELWMLSPNQLFVYNKSTKMGSIQDLSIGQTSDAVSWIQGRAVYSYRTLNDIFEIIERQFAVDIQVQSGVELGDREYVIQIDRQETPDVVIGALATLTDKFSFRIQGETILILPPEESNRIE